MKFIKLQTEKETVYIKPENIISFEVVEVVEQIDTDREDGVFEDCTFYQVHIITKHRIYKDFYLYNEIAEIEKEYNLI